LQTKLNRVPEAEQVLREGLRNNPNDPQLLFELGRIYFENYHMTRRSARNIWEAALRSWARQAPGVPQSERLETDQRKFRRPLSFSRSSRRTSRCSRKKPAIIDAAIARWELAKPASPIAGRQCKGALTS
jgi:hypothetical protein